MRLLAVAAAYGVAFVLFLRAMPSGLTSPWFVLVAMICFLGLAATARSVVRIRMPGPLRRIRAWEAESALYRRLGVSAFGRLLRRTPLRLLNRDVYMGARARDGARVCAQLEAAEASHFWDAVLIAPYMIHLALERAWTVLLWFCLAQLLVNAYPIMHLRLARHRLERLAARTPSGPALAREGSGG